MPYQWTDRNTSTASAAVVERSAVGPCKPGRMPTRLATERNTHSVPTNGRRRSAYWGVTAAIVSSMADTTPSIAVCHGPGDSRVRRVTSHETKNNNAITLHVVVTVSLIITGV